MKKLTGMVLTTAAAALFCTGLASCEKEELIAPAGNTPASSIDSSFGGGNDSTNGGGGNDSTSNPVDSTGGGNGNPCDSTIGGGNGGDSTWNPVDSFFYHGGF